jgi:hypothetical protein
MSDIFDEAQNTEAQFLKHSLAKQRNRSSRQLLTKGRCYYCNAETPGTFCDTDCRDDYELEQKLKTIGGKR